MVPVFHHFPGIYKYLCSVFSAIQCISSFVGWGGGVKITRLNQHIHCPLYISVPYIFHDTVSLHPFISSVIADNARSRAMKLVQVKEINTKFCKVHHECYQPCTFEAVFYLQCLCLPSLNPSLLILMMPPCLCIIVLFPVSLKVNVLCILSGL